MKALSDNNRCFQGEEEDWRETLKVKEDQTQIQKARRAVGWGGGWVCDTRFSISLLSLATTYSPLLLFFLLFFTFSLLQTKLYLYNAHPNCFFLLPAGHNVSPLLLSTPESCSFSSPFLSSLFILMTFLLPNDHFFFSFPSAPTPSRPNPVSLLFFGTFKQKSSLSSSSHLVSFSLLLF